eukprot:499503-Hanusia_phi.AAC.1
MAGRGGAVLLLTLGLGGMAGGSGWGGAGGSGWGGAGGSGWGGAGGTRVPATACIVSTSCAPPTSRRLGIRLRGGAPIPKFGWDQTAGAVEIYVFGEEMAGDGQQVPDRPVSVEDFSFQASATGFSLACSRWELTVNDLFEEIDAAGASFKIKDKYILVRLPKAHTEVLWPKLQKISRLGLEDIPNFPASWNDDDKDEGGHTGKSEGDAKETAEEQGEGNAKEFEEMESSSKLQTMMIERKALERLLLAAKENRVTDLKQALKQESQARSEPPSVILNAFRDANARGVAHWAAAQGHIAVIELAMRAGADMKARDANGQSPFFIAVVNRHMEVAKLLARNLSVDVNERDSGLRATPLHHAAGNGDLQMIHMLMLMNANVNATSILGSALQWAAMSECEEAFKLLLTFGADPNVLASDEGGRKVPPPLVMAASMNQHRVSSRCSTCHALMLSRCANSTSGLAPMCRCTIRYGDVWCLSSHSRAGGLYCSALRSRYRQCRALSPPRGARKRYCGQERPLQGLSFWWGRMFVLMEPVQTALQVASSRWKKTSQRYHSMRQVLVSLGKNLSEAELCDESDEDEEEVNDSSDGTNMDSRMTSAAGLKEQGNEALRGNRTEEAVVLYSEAIQLDPSRKEFFSNRAAALLALSRYDEALADAQVAPSCSCQLRLSWGAAEGEGDGRQLGQGLLPRGTGLKPLRRQAYLGLKEPVEAAASFWEAFRLDPSNVAAKSRFEEAVKMVRTVHAVESGRAFSSTSKQEEELKSWAKDRVES